MNLFGKDLFKKQKKEDLTLYDFAQHGLLKGTSNYDFNDYVQLVQDVAPGEADPNLRKSKPAEKAPELTPKEVYKLGTLTIPDMQINCDQAYLDDQIAVLKDKVELIMPHQPKPIKISRKNRKRFGIQIADAWQINSETDLSGVYKYALFEMQSMAVRLENRRKFKDFDFSAWPYTTNEAIATVLHTHKHLEAGNCAAMIPDLPKDAIKQIKAYEKLVMDLCGRKTNYYLIKEKAQRDDVQRRRDPILIAQSPYGFFWQILGAWDKEIKFLEEL
jgi:hypothetical protein